MFGGVQLANISLVTVPASGKEDQMTYVLCAFCRCSYQDASEHDAVQWAIEHYQKGTPIPHPPADPSR